MMDDNDPTGIPATRTKAGSKGMKIDGRERTIYDDTNDEAGYAHNWSVDYETYPEPDDYLDGDTEEGEGEE